MSHVSKVCSQRFLHCMLSNTPFTVQITDRRDAYDLQILESRDTNPAGITYNLRDADSSIDTKSPSRSAREYSRCTFDDLSATKAEGCASLHRSVSRTWRFSLLDDDRCGNSEDPGSPAPSSPFATSTDSLRSAASTECSSAASPVGREIDGGSPARPPWTLRPHDHLLLSRHPRFLRVLAGIGCVCLWPRLCT